MKWILRAGAYAALSATIAGCTGVGSRQIDQGLVVAYRPSDKSRYALTSCMRYAFSDLGDSIKLSEDIGPGETLIDVGKTEYMVFRRFYRVEIRDRDHGTVIIARRAPSDYPDLPEQDLKLLIDLCARGT